MAPRGKTALAEVTAWRAVTRVPLMIHVPEGVAPGLPKGTGEGEVCDRPVNLLSLFPTLTELTGVDPKEDNDGPSLVPLLMNPDAEWEHVSLTHLGQPGSYGMSTDEWRYIHYAGGGEELYHIAKDPYEWTNLVTKPEFEDKLLAMRALAPTEFAPRKEPSLSSMSSLSWAALQEEPAPASKPDGNPFPVTFVNRRNDSVELFWMSPQGEAKSYGMIASGKNKAQQTRPGAVWMLADGKSKKPLGYFEVGDRKAKAVIPKSEKK